MTITYLMNAELPMSNVYRFNFDNEIVNILKNFSKIHQYDDISSVNILLVH